jgi:hypothetical protein
MAPQRDEADVFNAKEVVTILVDLMKGVTAKEVTAATVNAAVGCAGKLVDLLRVHLDAKNLDLNVRRFEAGQRKQPKSVQGGEEDDEPAHG